MRGMTGLEISEKAQDRLMDEYAREEIAGEARQGGLRQEDVAGVQASSSKNSGSSSTTPTVGATILDWRARNIVTPVKNQGGCGSCWAFATSAFFESELVRTRPTQFNKTVNLSEQFLLNCDTSSAGCNGGSCVSAANLYISKGA